MLRFVVGLWCVVLGAAGAAMAQPITYEVRGEMYEQVIIAYVNGVPVQAMVPETGISSKILEADFDGDGQIDGLRRVFSNRAGIRAVDVELRTGRTADLGADLVEQDGRLVEFEKGGGAYWAKRRYRPACQR